MKDSESSKAPGPARSRGIREIRAADSHLDHRILRPAAQFIYNEKISGFLLLFCAIIALVWANSPWSHVYFALLDIPISARIGTFAINLDLP
jgi:hypothetical protein